jgi:AAA ATPase domain
MVSSTASSSGLSGGSCNAGVLVRLVWRRLVGMIILLEDRSVITGISIENFKGIRERVEVKLRPLTLLFGTNSAGKSSILHALQYAADE